MPVACHAIAAFTRVASEAQFTSDGDCRSVAAAIDSSSGDASCAAVERSCVKSRGWTVSAGHWRCSVIAGSSPRGGRQQLSPVPQTHLLSAPSRPAISVRHDLQPSSTRSSNAFGNFCRVLSGSSGPLFGDLEVGPLGSASRGNVVAAARRRPGPQ